MECRFSHCTFPHVSVYTASKLYIIHLAVRIVFGTLEFQRSKITDVVRLSVFSNVCSMFVHVLSVFWTMNICSGRLRWCVTVARHHSECKLGSQQVVDVLRMSTWLHITITTIPLPIHFDISVHHRLVFH